MKYKLYDKGKNDTSDVLKEVLTNRGIDDYKKYMNLDNNVLLHYSYLDNIDKAIEMFMSHFDSKNKISILVDSDPDGYCSAAMMYMYIKEMDKDYPVEYIMHKRAKGHGLTEDIVIPDDIKLLIIPDAGTNDSDECKKLKDNKIDILILDHHEKEEDNPYAVIVNNQMSERYANKDLCGAGVVYKFLQALDDENWNDFADNYLDLCALANISDVMDMRSYETRYLTDTGLENIRNKCLKALISAQDYSMKGRINIHNIQWYITPILNGMIRVGSYEEKELLFKAFIEEDEFFEYKKRAAKDKPAETINETIYDRAARLCKNAKSRQDKQKEKSVELITETAAAIPYDNKVIMLDISGILNTALTGVAAIKTAEMFNKPCILLNKFFDKKSNKPVYGGSARNINYSPIDSFKDIVNSTKVFNYGKGHANAFGVNLDEDKFDKAIKAINDILKDIEYDSTYRVDFIMDADDADVKLVTDLSIFDDIVCQGVEEPMIAVKDITLTRDCFEIFGKNEDTVSFNINDVKYIQFKCKEGNPLFDWLNDTWNNEESIAFTIVGTPSISEYKGIKIPQIIIKDLEIIKQ